MAEEPYEILPYREVASLKKDIADLKQRLGDNSSSQLGDSIANLSRTMENMLNLFQAASEDMKIEETGERGTSSDSSPMLAEISSKLDELIDQNKAIAEGIVAVADMIKGESREEMAGQEQPPLGAPRFGQQFSQPMPKPSPQFGLPMPGPMEMRESIPTPLGPFPSPGPPPELPKKRFF